MTQVDAKVERTSDVITRGCLAQLSKVVLPLDDLLVLLQLHVRLAHLTSVYKIVMCILIQVTPQKELLRECIS